MQSKAQHSRAKLSKAKHSKAQARKAKQIIAENSKANKSIARQCSKIYGQRADKACKASRKQSRQGRQAKRQGRERQSDKEPALRRTTAEQLSEGANAAAAVTLVESAESEAATNTAGGAIFRLAEMLMIPYSKRVLLRVVPTAYMAPSGWYPTVDAVATPTSWRDSSAELYRPGSKRAQPLRMGRTRRVKPVTYGFFGQIGHGAAIFSALSTATGGDTIL